MWYRAGIKPRPHWWETSALTTAPSLLPQNRPLEYVTKRYIDLLLMLHNTYEITFDTEFVMLLKQPLGKLAGNTKTHCFS